MVTAPLEDPQRGVGQLLRDSIRQRVRNGVIAPPARDQDRRGQRPRIDRDLPPARRGHRSQPSRKTVGSSHWTWHRSTPARRPHPGPSLRARLSASPNSFRRQEKCTPNTPADVIACRSYRAQKASRQSPEWNPAPSPTIIRPLSRRGPPPRALRTTRRTPSPPSSIPRVKHCILLRLTFPLTSANTYYVPTGCRCEHWGVEQYKRCPRGLGSCSLQWGLYHFGLASHEKRFSRCRVRGFRQWRCATRFGRVPSARLLCRYAWLLQLSAKRGV